MSFSRIHWIFFYSFILSVSGCTSDNNGTLKPNFLIIICDQLNPAVLSCYGGQVHTPNIDKLAEGGLLFEDAVCPYPVCSPSRASLILGQYPHEHGIIHNCMKIDYPATTYTPPETEEGITNREITLDKVLNSNGYTVRQFGKWHLSGEKLDYMEPGYGEHLDYALELKPVFEEVRKMPRAEWMDWYGWALPVKQSDTFKTSVKKTTEAFRNRVYSEFITKIGVLELPLKQNFDVRVTDKTVNAIKEMEQQQPFIITCSYNYPHDPNVVPEPYYSMFDPHQIILPANHEVIDPRFESTWSARMVAELGEPGVREFLRTYYASVKLIDDQVGRLLEALEEIGALDNTMVIFTADHGDMTGSHRMIWKSNNSFYDEVVRVPFLIYNPNRIEKGVAGFPINLADLAPTLLSLAHLEVPKSMTGNNLTDFITGSKNPANAPEFVLCERMDAHPGHLRSMEAGRRGDFMIRSTRWKYVLYSDSSEFVYDLVHDPGEQTNLALKTEFHTVKKELRSELFELLKNTHYKFAVRE